MFLVPMVGFFESTGLIPLGFKAQDFLSFLRVYQPMGLGHLNHLLTIYQGRFVAQAGNKLTSNGANFQHPYWKINKNGKGIHGPLHVFSELLHGVLDTVRSVKCLIKGLWIVQREGDEGYQVIDKNEVEAARAIAGKQR